MLNLNRIKGQFAINWLFMGLHYINKIYDADNYIMTFENYIFLLLCHLIIVYRL